MGQERSHVSQLVFCCCNGGQRTLLKVTCSHTFLQLLPRQHFHPQTLFLLSTHGLTQTPKLTASLFSSTLSSHRLPSLPQPTPSSHPPQCYPIASAVRQYVLFCTPNNVKLTARGSSFSRETKVTAIKEKTWTKCDKNDLLSSYWLLKEAIG